MNRHLIHIAGGYLWTGAARYALDICRHYRALGWEVEAFTRGSVSVDTHFQQAGIPVLHAPFSGLSDLHSAKMLSRRLKELPPGEAIVHAHGFRQAFTALLARRLAGRKDVRVVMTRHKVRRGTDSWLFRRIYRNLDAMVFASRLSLGRFLSTWHGRDIPFDASRVHVVAESLNIPLPTEIARADKGPVTAMYHGTLAPGKGLETLIDALALLKGTRLRLKIWGSGPADYADSLRRRALARGVMDSIDWKKDHADISAVMAEIDFGVLPSWTEEAFGIANLEFMAAGRPQVCSSNGAQAEYLTDGREGLLVPARDALALAEAMRRLATDPELRRRLGHRAAQTFATRLSWPRFAGALDKIYCPEPR